MGRSKPSLRSRKSSFLIAGHGMSPQLRKSYGVGFCMHRKMWRWRGGNKYNVKGNVKDDDKDDDKDKGWVSFCKGKAKGGGVGRNAMTKAMSKTKTAGGLCMYRKRWRWSGGKKWRKKEVSLSRLWKTRLFCHMGRWCLLRNHHDITLLLIQIKGYLPHHYGWHQSAHAQDVVGLGEESVQFIQKSNAEIRNYLMQCKCLKDSSVWFCLHYDKQKVWQKYHTLNQSMFSGYIDVWTITLRFMK